MKKTYFTVTTNTVSSEYVIKAQDPAYSMYDSMCHSIAELMARITYITKMVQAKNKVKACFIFE